MTFMAGARAQAIIGARPPAVLSGSAYDADAEAYFLRMSSQEPTPFKDAVNAFILSAKSNGYWSKFDRFYLPCTSIEANALYDVKAATKVWTRVGTTTWTTERGIAGDGTTGYVSGGEALNAAGNAYAQSSGLIGAYCNSSPNTGSADHPHFGSNGNARTFLSCKSAGGSDAGRVNSTSANSAIRSGADRKGHRSGSRTGASFVQYYFNGSPTTNYSTSSADPLSTHGAFGHNNGIFSPDRMAAGYWGSHLSDAEAALLHTDLTTLLTALGAN